MDVAAWLCRAGPRTIAQLFRDNDIDGEILCGMTAEDLKELGISSFGHRRRLLNAITALGGEPGRVMWLNRQRARYLLLPHLRQSTPNAAS
jgi:SAM domain (Sterile alpha motif)